MKVIKKFNERHHGWVREYAKHALRQDANLISAGIGLRATRAGAEWTVTEEPCFYFSRLFPANAPEKLGDIPSFQEFSKINPAPAGLSRLSVQYEIRSTGTFSGAGDGSASVAPSRPGSSRVAWDVEGKLDKIRSAKNGKPLFAGFSIGPMEDQNHKEPGALRHGTMGCFAWDKVSNEQLMLSCWHVMHSSTNVVIQPSAYHTTEVFRAGYVVAQRADLDCAVARIHKDRVPQAGKGAPTKVERAPKLGSRVTNLGSQHGITNGVIARIGVVRMNYGSVYQDTLVPCMEIASAPGEARLQLCRQGDSGSIWLLADEKGWATDTAVGLHFGEDQPVMERALAVPMWMVTDALNIRLTAAEPGKLKRAAAV